MINRLILPVAFLAMAALMLMIACSGEPKQVDAYGMQNQIERGKYLVNIGGCNDCHTPKIYTDKGPVPDESRLLAGHPANGTLPDVPNNLITPEGWAAITNSDFTAWVGPWGISYAANLTPDEVTGTGAWLESSFVDAMRNGKHMGTGRAILPPMPWMNIGQLSDDDLRAIFAYLQSLKPINNMVPQPVSAEKLMSGAQPKSTM
mgnify:CR=1 FL=1